MRAIRDVGGVLHAALDPNDSVGAMDSFFPDAHFFTEFERFDRHVDLLRRESRPIKVVSVCSPNYLHDAHCRFALRSGADVICEKPLVLNPWNINGLAEMEQATGQRIFNILQLRLHPAVKNLKASLEREHSAPIHEVDLTYVTPRGRWFAASWKGDPHKSGGIATNIGVHFFDMLVHVFGEIRRNLLHLREDTRSAGYLELERARVRWFLSVDGRDLPEKVAGNAPSYRSLTVDGEEFEFSDGFTDLHTESYRQILDGNGFGIDEVRPSIEAVAHLREAQAEAGGENRHPFLTGGAAAGSSTVGAGGTRVGNAGVGSASSAGTDAVAMGSAGAGGDSSPCEPRPKDAGVHPTAQVHHSAYIDPPCQIGPRTRIWHFSHLMPGCQVGRDCVIGQNVMIGPNVIVGDRCKIQNNVSIYEGVTLDDGVFCGPSCVFTNVNNPRAKIERKDQFQPTRVRHGATIGANATIVCGHEIGAHAFIAAGAVVTRNVPEHAIVAGVPA